MVLRKLWKRNLYIIGRWIKWCDLSLKESGVVNGRDALNFITFKERLLLGIHNIEVAVGWVFF